METVYNGVSWNTQDLMECKQAFVILYFHKKVSMSIIDSLDFGNLDIDAVMNQLNN